MSNFYRYFEFISKNSLNSQELLKVETFFKNIGLNFIFTVDSVNKHFGRVASGLKYDTGGGYNHKKGHADFIFCGYRGPKPEELVEEIEELLRSYDTKEIFEWLKEKKYIFCVEYFMSIQGPSGDTFNLAFGNKKQNDKLNLYELNLLLTKIFKIYLIDDAFKVSNIFKTDFVGIMGNSKKNSPGARNILYKKFLTRYLNELPGKPYRLFHREKITDQKPKNLLRKKGKNISIEDSIVTKSGLVIVPKKIYLRKILQNKTIEEFVKILQKIDKETSYNIENKKVCLDFINDKIIQKEAEDKLKNVNRNEIITYCLQAKKEKKEIDDILSKQRKKISFNEFINQYINLSNRTNYTKNSLYTKIINNKFLKPSRSKELMFRHEREMDDIVLISNFIKDNNIKFDKMKEITLEKITERINLVKNKALDLQKKIEIENEIDLKKDEEISEKLDDLYVKVRKEIRKKQELVAHKQTLIFDKKQLVSDKEITKTNVEDELKTVKDVEKEIEALEKKIEPIEIEIEVYRNELYPIIDKTQENAKQIQKHRSITSACDFLIKYFFTEKSIKKYGHKSLKNMITDIYRSNLFNSKEIKSFLFEMNIVKNNFQLYLFFS